MQVKDGTLYEQSAQNFLSAISEVLIMKRSQREILLPVIGTGTYAKYRTWRIK
jgi:hypothetical protein